MMDFEQIFKDIDELFCDVFIPNSRDLIESDVIQNQLFQQQLIDLVSPDDPYKEYVPVTLAGISENCTLSLRKTYRPSELVTAPKDDQRFMARNYDVLIEKTISPAYLVRCHWSVYLTPLWGEIYVLPKHRWLINMDDSGKVIGQIDYVQRYVMPLQIKTTGDN